MAGIQYRPEYAESWALIIGIDEYSHCPRLGYACNDAKAVAHKLRSAFRFPDNHVTLLLDQEAGRDSIRRHFLALADAQVSADDRLLVFYAGHGHTRAGSRGEVGFLVPSDGNPQDLSSLIRWDELTRGAELIQAKHVLFVMDACYGGLALIRGAAGGHVRFLHDMLRRFSRQVLTAGKADEVVADSGGPLPGHSVFTGHFLQALDGKAASTDGIITANTVMAYVYERVAKDPHSHQTPHFGFLDGDGDFIFRAPLVDSREARVVDDAIQFVIPPTIQPTGDKLPPLVARVKELIADPRQRIALHDVVVEEMRRVIAATNAEAFPVQTLTVTPEEFLRRLQRYEAIAADIVSVMLSLAHWGETPHIPLMQKVISGLTSHLTATSGKVIWSALRWYPTTLLLYAGGIGSLAAERYDNLAAVLFAKIRSLLQSGLEQPAVDVVSAATVELTRADAFKFIPGHERHYVPESEYLFGSLQPVVDDVLFVGQRFEPLFDRYEVFHALVMADLTEKAGRRAWGPLGRFGWKYNSLRVEENPFVNVVNEAEEKKQEWAPLRAGLFDGSYERFAFVVGEYARLLRDLHWS